MIFNNVSDLQSHGFNPKVCIIGSGPAGITLALQLEKKGIPCIIVEAGGFDYDPTIQEAYKGTVIGDPYFDLYVARLRYFGGTSGHWEGCCRPLNEVDFEPRPGYTTPGWPIRKKDLDPYSKDADLMLELEPMQADEPLDEDWKKIHFRFSPPVRFGTKYRKHIEASSTIGLLLYSTVTDMVPVKGAINHAVITSGDGKKRRLNAEFFCICTGGIENSRLLLWFNQINNGGVVPQATALGKYWMEHPIFGAAEAVLLDSFSMPAKNTRDGTQHYAPTPRFMAKHGIGNIEMRVFIGDAREFVGDSAKYVGGTFTVLLKSGLCIAPEFFTKVAQKHRLTMACGATLRAAWEQMPLSSNRIELDTATDQNGIPRVKLFWKKQPIDRLTLETAVHSFGNYLAKSNQGRIKLNRWVAQGLDYPGDDEKAGFHHMGGTRMGADSTDGVVDHNCKVFGVDNLYVGGSSVFTTSGFANPTYTIVQLALRLGDHIGQRLALGHHITQADYPNKVYA